MRINNEEARLIRAHATLYLKYEEIYNSDDTELINSGYFDISEYYVDKDIIDATQEDIDYLFAADKINFGEDFDVTRHLAGDVVSNIVDEIYAGYGAYEDSFIDTPDGIYLFCVGDNCIVIDDEYDIDYISDRFDTADNVTTEIIEGEWQGY